MSDHLRPSLQAENFRGNDVSPMREAAYQAYSQENQGIFRIDIRSSKGTDSLPGLQIVFEQDSKGSRGNSGRDQADSRQHCDDDRRDFSPPRHDSGSESRQDSRHDSGHNPWHHGHERHSHSHHRMNDSANNDFLGNDRTFNNSYSSRFDRQTGNDNTYVSTDSPPWESANSFGIGSGRDSRYASPMELLNQLVDYFRQNELSNSLTNNRTNSGFSSTDGNSGPLFRMVDSSYKGPGQTSPVDVLDSLPTPPGLPKPGDLLSALPTPPGLPKPGDLLSALPTPPGLPKPGDLLSALPTPPGLPKPGDLLSALPTPPGLPKPGDLLSALPTPPGLPKPGDLLSALPTPPGLPKPGDLLSALPTPPGLPSPKNLFDKLPNPFKLFG